MRLVILTSMDRGLASLALPALSAAHDVAGVIKVEQAGAQGSGLKRKLKKVRQIGLLGAINGIRIRPWFLEEPMQRLEIRPLDDVAQDCSIPVHHTPLTNSVKTMVAMRELAPDLAISLGNSFISKAVFSIPKLGMINVHHEVLPEYKGAQSVIWQIFNGSSETGYTVHQVNEKIDGGKILLVERRPILFSDNLHRTVVNTLADVYAASVQGLIKTIDQFGALEQSSAPQVATRSFTTPSAMQFIRMLRQHRKLSSKR